MRNILGIPAFIVVTLLAHTACSQQPQLLPFNTRVTVSLKAGDVRQFTLSLKKGEFASVKILQKSVGISYIVYAPGDSLIASDDLNALYQAEIVNIAATKSGNYRLDIHWDYGRPQSGEFEITWTKKEPLAATASSRAAQLMEAWYAENEPGAAAIVVKKGKVIFKSVKGLADLENKVKVTSSSAFELASSSKQFTGMAVAMLVDKGLINLQEDIRSYLPELPDFGKKITVENLVYHTSGLRDWDDITNAIGMSTGDPLNIEMIYRMVSNIDSLNFNPGDRFGYSNTNYNLLVLIIEKVTKQKFSKWMKENIFDPLQMKYTAVRDDFKIFIPGRVRSYKATANGFIANTDNLTAPGSSSVLTSIDDLSEWITNFDTHKIGSPNLYQLLGRKTKLNNGDSISFYSFGNGFGNRKGISNIEHPGLVGGFRATIARYPSLDLAVAFVSSDNNDAMYARAGALTDLFLEGITEQPLKPVKLPDLQKFLDETQPYVPRAFPGEAAGYNGLYYCDELNTSYKVSSKNGLLMIACASFSNTLSWEKDDTFSSMFSLMRREVRFTRDGAGKIRDFRLMVEEKPFEFKKVGE